MRRWLALGGYAALLYGLLPFGPAIGRAVQQSAVGTWVLGGGAGWLVAAGALVLVVRLRRRRAPAVAWALAALAALGYAGALLWLRAVRLERVHVPEYGIAAWLAWRALVPRNGDRVGTYVAAAAIAAAIGWSSGPSGIRRTALVVSPFESARAAREIGARTSVGTMRNACSNLFAAPSSSPLIRSASAARSEV